MKINKIELLYTLKICKSIFKIKLTEGFQYRIAALSSSTTSIFWAFIEITIFSVFYKYADNLKAGVTAGISLKQMVSYIWIGQILFFIQPRIDGDIMKKITSGDIGIELCRPIDLYLHWFTKTASARLSPIFWSGSAVLLAGFIMPSSYRLSMPASMEGFLLMLVSTISAFFLCASFAMLVSIVRINIVWGDGPMHIMMLISGVLSGLYLPLQLWPSFMQKFLLIQPFAGYLDIPVRLYIGSMNPSDAFFAIGLQIFWTVVFLVVGKLLMTKQLKNIIVQGG